MFDLDEIANVCGIFPMKHAAQLVRRIAKECGMSLDDASRFMALVVWRHPSCPRFTLLKRVKAMYYSVKYLVPWEE